MLKYVPLVVVMAAALTACGGSDSKKKSSSSSSVAVSSSAPAASSTPASSKPASSTPASSTPASSTPASSTPAVSSVAASEIASSTPASSTATSSSSAAAFDGTFTNTGSITFWSTTPNWQTPAGTATQAIVNGALVINPTWAAIKDGFNVEATLPQTLDLTGATISFKVYVPEAYVADGRLAVQAFFKDAGGKFANGGWKETAWGPWRYSGSETSATNNATDNKFGWATLSFVVGANGLDDPSDTDPASWGYNPDGLDITKVTHFGIEIVSKDKPVNVTGEIKIDDVVLPGL